MGGHEVGETPGDGVSCHIRPLQPLATVFFPSFCHSLGHNDEDEGVGHCGSPSHVGSEVGAEGVGEASLAEGATLPSPSLSPALGHWGDPLLTDLAALWHWMVAPSWEEATGTPGELAAAWGLPWGPPWSFPPALVLADGVLHPQDSSASLGSRHTHHEREYRSLARRDPSHRQTDRRTDKQVHTCVQTHVHTDKPFFVGLPFCAVAIGVPSFPGLLVTSTALLLP